MAAQLGRNVRQYVNRISALSKPPFPGSSSISQTRAQHQLAADAPPVSDSKAVTILANLFAASSFGVFFYGTFYQAYKCTKPWQIGKIAEKKAMEKLKRKLNTVEAKLCKSRGDGEKLMVYEREFAALKEFVSPRDEEAEKITKHSKVG